MSGKTYNQGKEDGEEDREDTMSWVPGASLGRDLGRSVNHAIEGYSEKDEEDYQEGHQEGLSDDSGSSSGGCYITTACVSARGLSDNCLELRILRNFREKILNKSSKGKKALKDYDILGPRIVEAVNSKKDSFKIWENVYKDISTAVKMILSGDYKKAFEHYKQMTSGLTKFIS